MKIRVIGLIILIVLVLVIVGSQVLAQERITSFHSDILINKDGTMNVTETIKVISQQDEIRHGIYRDFPTRYKDLYGNRFVVGFKVQSITRDGSPEPYHFGKMENGTRIYIGSADDFVSVGAHIYTITYTTDRQLGFFKDHDELYWNVTGNGWVFPIESASAVVRLPKGIPTANIKTNGWTGPQGSTDKNLKYYVGADGRIGFYTSGLLNSNEGLTVAVWWPKGFVDEPTQEMRTQWFIRDNISSVICLIGLIVVICYFILAQAKVGIDPKKGSVVPQWDPPDGLSPAAIRYISRMRYDNKTLSCALINAAVKGYIEINEDGGIYTIKRKGTDKSILTSEEFAAIDGMLLSSDHILLDQSNNAFFSNAIREFTSSLKAHFGSAYFATHMGYAVFGAALSLLTIIAALVVDPLLSSQGPEGILTLMLGMWTLVTSAILVKAVLVWREVRYKLNAVLSAAFITIFAVAFLVGEVSVIVLVAGTTSIPILVAIFLFVCVNAIFFQLLQAYTKRGRALMDKAEGLKLYMRVAEQERLDILNPPDRTPQLFEKLLPYALALGVEQQWSEQFADVLAKAQAEGYHPAWYAGSGFYSGGYSGFASSLGDSFSSAISSASTPPGSSGGGGGGFSGGGSSGGGGGGGGGGGW